MMRLNPIKKITISTQFFLNYMILFALTIVILVGTVFGLLLFYASHLKNVAMDFDQAVLYENTLSQSAKKAVTLQKLPKDISFEILDQNLVVLDSYNSPKKTGYKYKITEFNKILYESTEGFLYIPENSGDDAPMLLTYLSESNNMEATIKKLLKLSFSLFIFLFLATSLIYAKLTSDSLVKPIRKIVLGVNSIAKGDYDTLIEFNSKNELSILRDSINQMTQTIKDEIRLREKAEMNTRRLILDISHDLKTPLTNILGYSETLKLDSNLSENEDKYLGIVISNAKRANSLIQDLFELSKIDMDEKSTKLDRTDICEFIRLMLIDYIGEFEQKGIEYDFNIPEEPIYVMLNSKHIDRALGNIIINAMKYNDDDISLDISLVKSEDFIEIRIADTGVGIDESLAADIFEPFFRGDPSRSSTGGTGLGLAITKTIFEKHGGSIMLDTSYKEGCRFIIRLPYEKQS